MKDLEIKPCEQWLQDLSLAQRNNNNRDISLQISKRLSKRMVRFITALECRTRTNKCIKTKKKQVRATHQGGKKQAIHQKMSANGEAIHKVKILSATSGNG